MVRVLGIMMLVIGASSVAFAGVAVIVPVVPELSGGTAMTALALLSGGVAVLRARLKR